METISSWRVHGGKKANLCWPFLLRFTQAAIHGILRSTPPTQILNQTPTCLGWTGTLHMAPWLYVQASQSQVLMLNFRRLPSEGDACPFYFMSQKHSKIHFTDDRRSTIKPAVSEKLDYRNFHFWASWAHLAEMLLRMFCYSLFHCRETVANCCQPTCFPSHIKEFQPITAQYWGSAPITFQ